MEAASQRDEVVLPLIDQGIDALHQGILHWHGDGSCGPVART
jgi:hypothetical protein